MRDNFYDGVVLDGRYKTIAPLNHGSFGMVFQAKDLTTNNIVAIKCLTKNPPTDEFASSFAVDEKSEELACHARLGSHNHIVNLIHSFETEAHVYLVLEYCPKGDLYEAIRTRPGPWQTEFVRVLMLQLVDAVAYIHSKSMYHRDIKPENIFLTASNDLKLGDFGLATTEEWSYETTVGSDRYMSPEQYDAAGAGYSPAQADIWAIGVCLLNILFARNPFTTPTESDNLFLDFSKDRQSLFDVFPTMSQDTFEVIGHCMSLDPQKRSLSATREALLRAVCFTTDDETLDDFDVGHPTVASANREPLRTPSIQSPQVDQGAFPWAKHLHASSAQAIRQLSVIQDTESYTEDLFPSSENSNKDWFSVNGQTPSMSSILESSLAASMSSLAVHRAGKKASPLHADLTPISGSLPITMSRPKLVPSMSTIFGRQNDMVSKSWSEMYDEDTGDDQEMNVLKERQAQNARTYSHESNADDVTVRRETLTESKSSFVNLKSLDTEAGQSVSNDVDSDTVNDGFFFQDTTEVRHYSPPRYSPPPKRITMDKWAALGDRRRAYMGGSKSDKSPDKWRGRRNIGVTSSTGFSGFGAGVWDFRDKAHNHRTRACPWVKDRDQHFQNHRKDRGSDLGDLEWVGGWQDSPDLQL
jgi:serine/threonine protein kinase